MLKKIINPFFWLNKAYCYIKKIHLNSCGTKFHVNYPTTIRGGKNIFIGNNFSSMGVLYLYANESGKLIIGDNCSINTNVQLGASDGQIIIGNNVLIAPNVVIRAANHGIKKGMLINQQPNSYGEIVIEDDVWIGSNVVITAGVTLAKGTVVAAGAVVTKSSEAYSIIAGVPAKKINERV